MPALRDVIATGVRNSVFANVLMGCILVAGFLSGKTLVKETYPEFSLDRISIEAAYPGASPEEVEHGVTTRIERALEGTPGILKIWSRAGENGGLVMVELADGANPRLMMLDIKDRIDRITTFPSEVERPIVSEAVVRDQVIRVAVYGDASERALRDLALEVKDELLREGTVSQINLVGVRDEEISIQVSREALMAYSLSLETVTAIVAKSCVDIPAGSLRTDREEFAIRTTGQRYTAQHFEDLVLIANPDGALIKLGQVATIQDTFEESFKTGRFQGKPACMLEVFKTPKEDTTTLARGVRQYVEQKSKQLPEALKITCWADSSHQVDSRLTMLVKNGILGMLLVVVVLSLFLDFRISLYVAAGIPVAFAGSLIVMHLLGETINMMTLLGMIMVTGIIVDDAIVIADSFRMRVAQGDRAALAAANGTADVALPVLAASVTTIIAFVPLLFVVGIMGKFIAVLPVVVISAIVFSSIEAFCILPAHLKSCMAPSARPSRFHDVRQAMRGRIDAWTLATIARVYRPIMHRTLDARGVTIAAAVACAILTAGLVFSDRIAFTLLPEADADLLRARLQFPLGTPVEHTLRAVGQLEQAASRLNDPEVLTHHGQGNLVTERFAAVGEWSGWIDLEGSHYGEVLIGLMPAEKRKLGNRAILAAWQQQTGVIDNVLSLTFETGEIGPSEKPLEIRLLGDDLDQLRDAADETATELAAFDGVLGVTHDLVPGKRQVRIRLKPLARTLGITLDDLARQLRSGFFGGEAVRVQRGRDEIAVQVRLPDDQRTSISDIENLRIRGANDQEIPFSELATFQLKRGYANILHQGGQRRVRIMADVDERRANAERILADFDQAFLQSLPQKYPTVRYRLEGQHAQMIKSIGSLATGFAIALVAIYGVLATMLRSYTEPMIIMATIPLGFVGAILGHAITGYDLTIMSVFGLVALSGVVVNDALVLLDQIKRILRDGSLVFDAVIEAGAIRFRAVLLTTITTAVGLAPLLSERSTQAQALIPMAISLAFGLAGATVLTLVIVPALYLAANDLRRATRWLWRGGAYPSAEAVEPLCSATRA